MNERDIFFAALEITDSSARREYLDQACAGNVVLRASVDALFASHEGAGDFLKIPIVQPAAAGSSADTAIDKPSAAMAQTGFLSREQQALNAENDAPSDDDEIPLGFLSPSTKPGSRGRLAHYEVLEVLGKGAFGTVLKAFDEKLHRMVAIKVMSAVLASTSPARKRFLREARSAAAIRHENVVAIHAVEEQPIPYLVMEYIPGRTLQQVLDAHGPLDVGDTLRLSHQIASGLAAAHSQGLIHRDIKPANILLEDGIKWKVKISDFGLARAADDASVTQSGTIAGTPMYMSPEQAHSNHIDQRSDLFSFGSVLYQMISGRPPFRAATTLAVLKRVTEDTPRPIQEIIPEVPDWLCTIISKLHSKRAEDRYQTASEVAELLARCQSELQHAGNVTCVQSSHHAPRDEPSSTAPSSTSRPQPDQTLSTHTVAQPGATPKGSSRGAMTATEEHQSSHHAPRDEPSSAAPPSTSRPPSEPFPSTTITPKGSSRGAMTATFGGHRRWLLAAGFLATAALITFFMINRDQPTPLASGGRQLPSDTPSEISNSKSRISNPESQIANLQPTDPDRRAAEYVLSIGGKISIKENGQERDIATVADLPGGAFELTIVHFDSHSPVSDTGLALFQDCRNLTLLDLTGTEVTDAGLAYFRTCNNLTTLCLNHSRRVSDTGLAHFEDCDDLRILILSGTQVTVAGLAYFKDCKILEIVELFHTAVGDAGLVHLKDCENLGTLLLGSTQVGDAGLAHIKDCTKMHHLVLNGTQVSDVGLSHLKNWDNLTAINLNDTRVTDMGVLCLMNCRNLQVVGLNGTLVSDVLLHNLANLPDLTLLHLDSTRISLRGRQQLKVALPKCQIVWSEPNRSVAECVLFLGGVVAIGIPGQANSRPVQTAADLPAEFFQVRRVSLAGITKPLDTLPAQLALLHSPAFDQVESLDLSGIKGLGLEFLVSIHGLKELSLADMGMGDAGLVNISNFPTLQRLVLDGNNIQGLGLKSLELQPALTELSLANNGLTDESLTQLPKLPLLKRLVLDGNDIRGTGLKVLTAQPKLIDLSLGCPTLGDLLARNLAELTQIKRLSLAGSGLSDVGIKHLAGLAHLESLDLRRTEVTAAGISELQTALPKCQIQWDGEQNK